MNNSLPDESMLEVLRAWDLSDATVTPIEIGLINRTFQLTRGTQRWILQRLNPIFRSTVHHDIEAITSHVARKGLTTPRLVATRDGALWLDHDGVWRVFTFLEGRVLPCIESPSTAETAGRLVGQFHGALLDLTHVFNFTRPGVHDLSAHRDRLILALDQHRNHALIDRVAPIAHRLLHGTETLPGFTSHPTRIAHGDLKITNILFNDLGSEALALLDLDTMAHMPLAYEMGDALRSWCNPAGEDQSNSGFNLEIFRAALTGYADTANDWITAEEWNALGDATRFIALELAIRFCADALNENYFGWNALRFTSRGEHNLFRATGQLSLADSIESQRAEIERALQSVLLNRRNSRE